MTQIARLSTWQRPLVLLATLAAFVAGPVLADISLRVESRPNTEAIEAFVRVTDGSGPVTGLMAADFAVTLDGAALYNFTSSLPPDQDLTQKVSVVVVNAINLSVASQIVNFINQMVVGDYAAIIGFRPLMREGYSRPFARGPVVQPLTQIDAGPGTDTLIDFLSIPFYFVSSPTYTMLFDAIRRAVEQFASPPVALPNGPKAIILIGNSVDSYSRSTQSGVVAYANEHSIAIFTVGVGNIAENSEVNRLMAALAEETGGTYLTASDNAQIEEALVAIAGLLNDAYLLTIPHDAATDCFPHVLEVTSQGQSENIAFTRCDGTPDEFQFADQAGVAPGTVVVSDAITITGINGPTSISVEDGEYSAGCGSTFTTALGIILPGQQVCVRHTASADYAALTSTLLIVGGVSSRFSSTTRPAPAAAPPAAGGGGGGGGGASGMVELLFALGAMLVRRRRC